VAHPLDGFGMLIPEVEGFSILGALFSSSLFPNRAQAGHVTLTCYLGGMRAPKLGLLNSDAAVELAVKDLRAILGVKGEPTFRHHFVFPKAIPQYEVGFGRFKDLMNQIEMDAPGLFLAGHYRDGISLGDSIVSGHEVVERIQGFLRTLPPAALSSNERRESVAAAAEV
jgi:oxygen-dependent protoporphyrinogen oxidase